MKSLFNENHGIPQHASSRIQRWALKLASYEYTISFRPTHKHGNADALSRLPIKDSEGKDEDLPTELVLLMEAMDQMPITARNIRKWTQSDPLLSRVYCYTQKGWPTDILETLKLYSSRRTELSTLNVGLPMFTNHLARFGLPQTIVSDNGSSFTSTEFQKFVKVNGINHVLTAPYQPQANGLAECMVLQAFKNSLKKCTNGTITSKLNRF